MRKVLLFLVQLTLTVFVCRATGQASERMIIGRDTFEMLTLPIESDSVVSAFVRQRYQTKLVTTACWRGYVGEWELVDDMLYLNKLQPGGDGKWVPVLPDGLWVSVLPDGLFETYNDGGRVKATWFTGELRLAKGDYIYYVHDGFLRYYPDEWIYQVERGRVISKQYYRNTFRKPQLTTEESFRRVAKLFNRDLFPELKGKRLMVRLSIRPNADGSFHSVRIGSIRFWRSDTKDEITDMEHPYWVELLRCLKEIPDWEVLTVRGEIKVLHTWTFPIQM